MAESVELEELVKLEELLKWEELVELIAWRYQRWKKAGDAGDAVSANFFPAVLIFWIFTNLFAQFCIFLHNFVVFFFAYF